MVTRALAPKAKPVLAKFSQPGTARPIQRLRLFDQLDAQRHCPLMWVSGPPGAGKTTLISTYLTRDKYPTLWFRVDEGDRDAATFFSYLTQAAAALNPKLAKKLPNLTPEYLLDVAGFCRRYFRELFEGLPAGCALVLDSFEAAKGGSIEAFLPLAAAQLPPGMRLVVTSRIEVPPALAHLQTKGEMAMVNAQDLALTQQEALDIAAVDAATSPVSVITLHELSCGWAAGYVVMLAHARRNGSISLKIDGGLKESLFSFFINELFSQADAPTRDLLLRTAVLSAFTSAQAATLCTQGSAAAILQLLHREHFFTDRSGGLEPSYRYHALFRSFLLEQGRLLMGGPQRQALLVQAAALLVQAESGEEACHLLVEAQDWGAAGRLLCEMAPAMWRQGRFAVLEELIAALPTRTLDDMPWLSYWLGMSRQLFSPQLGRALFASSLARFKAQNNPQAALTVCSAVMESLTLEMHDMHPIDPWANEYEALSGQLDRAARAAGDCGTSPTAISRRFDSLCCIWFRADRHVELLHRAQVQALDIVEHSNNPVACVTAANFVCYLLIFRGEMDQVRRVISQLDARLTGSEIPPVRAIMWFMLKAWPAHLGADVELAASYCSQAEGLSSAHGIHVFDVIVASHGVYPALIAGDVVQAEICARKMASCLLPGRDLDAANYDWVMANISLAKGEAHRALEQARGGLVKAAACGAHLFESHCRMAMAHAHLALGNAGEALAQANEILRFATQAQFNQYEHTGLMIKAGALLQTGDTPEARAALQLALEMGRQRGFVVIFPLAPASFLQTVYVAALNAGIETQYVQSLIRKLKLAPPALAGNHWPWRVTVHTLGRFEISVDGLAVEHGRKTPKRPLALLKLLIAQRGKVRMDVASDALWPDEDADAGARSLDVALHRLRRMLGDTSSIELHDGMLQLDLKSIWVDAMALDDTLDISDQGGKTASNLRAQALQSYTGHFLHDQPEVWAGVARERLRARFNRTVAAHGLELEAAKTFGEAAAHYARAIDIDGLFETAYQGLMRCHLARGWRSEGLACFERLRLTLLAFGGLKPLVASVRLQQLLESTGTSLATSQKTLTGDPLQALN
jgi:ATP/maltotriose-dependent transcriptional regulator MalT/DNA-binding SARP family transcriptional activator